MNARSSRERSSSRCEISVPSGSGSSVLAHAVPPARRLLLMGVGAGGTVGGGASVADAMSAIGGGGWRRAVAGGGVRLLHVACADRHCAAGRQPPARAARGIGVPWRARVRPSGRRCARAGAISPVPARPARYRRSPDISEKSIPNIARSEASGAGVRRAARSCFRWPAGLARPRQETRRPWLPGRGAGICLAGSSVSPSFMAFLKPRNAEPRSEPKRFDLLAAEDQQHDQQDEQQMLGGKQIHGALRSAIGPVTGQ